MTIVATTHALTRGESRLRAKALGVVSNIEKTLKEYADDVLVPALRKYPPPVSGRRSKRTGGFVKGGYVRTYRLREHWIASPVFNSGNDILTVVLLNDVVDPHGEHYASKVQDQEDQREVHQDRWLNTIQAVRQENAHILRARIRQAVQTGLVK